MSRKRLNSSHVILPNNRLIEKERDNGPISLLLSCIHCSRIIKRFWDEISLMLRIVKDFTLSAILKDN